MFAFDEIVSLGYRESVSLGQVKDILKMDSQEENLQEAIKQRQIENAQSHATMKATEIAMQIANNGGIRTGGISSANRGIGSSGGSRPTDVYVPPSNQGKYSGIGSGSRETSSNVTSSSSSSSGGLPAQNTSDRKLKEQSKPSSLKQMILNRPNSKKGSHSLLNDLVSKGDITPTIAENTSVPVSTKIESVAEQQKKVKVEDIHLQVKETLQVETNREGGLNSLDVKGEMHLAINETGNGFIKVRLVNDLKDGFVSKIHPNIDKKEFSDQRTLALKRTDKPFQIGRAHV